LTAVQDKILSSLNTTPRIELGRLCREICLAAEQAPGSAESLEEKIEGAAAQVRARYGEASLSADDLLEIFQREQNRVADALVLAELLAPRLAAQLQKNGALAVSPSSRASSEPPPRSPTPPAANRPPAVPAGIADLIDGMLDQERREPRKRSQPPSRL
jgi:hypothetical protein